MQESKLCPFNSVQRNRKGVSVFEDPTLTAIPPEYEQYMPKHRVLQRLYEHQFDVIERIQLRELDLQATDTTIGRLSDLRKKWLLESEEIRKDINEAHEKHGADIPPEVQLTLGDSAVLDTLIERKGVELDRWEDKRTGIEGVLRLLRQRAGQLEHLIADRSHDLFGTQAIPDPTSENDSALAELIQRRLEATRKKLAKTKDVPDFLPLSLTDSGVSAEASRPDVSKAGGILGSEAEILSTILRRLGEQRELLDRHTNLFQGHDELLEELGKWHEVMWGKVARLQGEVESITMFLKQARQDMEQGIAHEFEALRRSIDERKNT